MCTLGALGLVEVFGLDAEEFDDGLAQGGVTGQVRVGRGVAPGLCLLVSEAPPASPARERLDAVAATLDGFQLSRLDLEQRREGDVLGAAQAGRKSSLRLLTLLSDEKLIAAARQEAIDLIEADPALAGQPALAAAAAALAGQQQAEYLEKA